MNKIVPVEILLVEDNAEDAALTLRALSRQRLANRVEVVEDGAQALDFLFRRGKFADRLNLGLPRVIFLDLKLPKVNGLDVLRDLKTNDATRKIPVVILTSSNEDNDIRTAYALGVNSYIVKPVDFEEFTKIISDLGMYWLILNEPPR